MATPININTATYDLLKNIKNIGDKRAKKIIEIRDIKGRLTLEDLKIIPNIPSSIWDPLVEEGLVIVPSTLRKSQELETRTENVPNPNISQTNKELQQKIECLEREMLLKEQMIKERESLITEREKEIQEKDLTINTKQEELSLLQKSLKANREKDDKMFEEMSSMITMREHDMSEKMAVRERELDEQLQKFVEQKEKLRILEEKESAEREEIFRSRMREIAEREKELEKREKDLKQMKVEREHKEYISNINRLAPQNIYSNTSERGEDIRSHARTTHSPAPPKLSTYDGKTEWKPYYIQFNHIAQKYMWNDREKLDRLIECLREKALKFFSSRPENVQKDFKLLCQKLRERFDKKDQPHIIRRQLQEIQQNTEETIEEFAERIEELSTEAYPDTPDFFRNTITIDAFLRGCTEKRAALVTLDKDPKTLDEAVQYLKGAITNQKLIMGSKRDVRRVTFEEGDNLDAEVRMINKSVQRTTPSLESRITSLEADNKETKKLLKEILESIKNIDTERSKRQIFFRSPQNSPNKYIPRSNSPSRERERERVNVSSVVKLAILREIV